MKKIFIGLLILAAGAGAYYLLNQKKNTVNVHENNASLLPGQWKSVMPEPGKDSSLLAGLHYEVLKDGTALVRDSAEASPDSIFYSWTATGDLQFREHATDSTAENFNVVLLNKDSLQLKDKENKLYLFTRL